MSTHTLENAAADQAVKRRKLEQPVPNATGQERNFISRNGTILDIRNGTMTPIPSDLAADADVDATQTKETDIDMMDTIEDSSSSDCPCGYLHGPGEHNDLKAVGLAAVPLLRGPQ